MHKRKFHLFASKEKILDFPHYPPYETRKDPPMDILYQDNRILVCVKPAGIRSTDEPGACRTASAGNWGTPTPASARYTGWIRWWAA